MKAHTLFKLRSDAKAALSTCPQITTPLGAVLTYAQARPLDTRHTLPVEQRVFPDGTEWRRWETVSLVAEVLIGPYSPELPSHMSVDGCFAAVWRVQARTNLVEPSLSCRLPADVERGPSSGEGLDAQTWWGEHTTLSIGTEDGEYLHGRAARGLLIPDRLMPECNCGTVSYRDDGLQVPFSSLEPGEVIQVHFVVAWAPVVIPDGSDTWFAVGQWPTEILRQLGTTW